MNRRFQFAVVASSTCVVALLLFGAVFGRSASTDNPYPHLGVYSEVLSRIKADYVEKPDMKAVTLGAINGMLESLDPYASYLNADQYKQYLKAKEGKPQAALGLILSKRFGYMGIVDAVPGSPAAKAGLGTGDVLESINNVSTRDMPLAFAQILLQGEAGTNVELGVLRYRRSEPQKVTVARAAIVYPAVSGRLDGQIGIIATSTLDTGRVKDIATKIAELQKQGANRFVLDLRHCSSGPAQEGVALANLFMNNGLITYTQGQKSNREDFQAVAAKSVTNLPVSVIVNRSTAGAAEVAAAALLNAKRAQVVGEHTYGDAAVRKAITLDDGSAVILSVAKYYSPDGKAIQDNGVTPNVQQAEVAEAAPDADDDSLPDLTPADPTPGAKPSADLLLDMAKKIVTEAK